MCLLVLSLSLSLVVESVWPLGILIDMCLSVVLYYIGNFNDMPYFNFEGLLWNFLIHVTLIEFVYYWWHVALHWKFLYKNWHQYHHASINTEPTTGYSFEIGERLSYTTLFAVTPLLLEYYGMQSYFTFAFNMIWFDIMNGGGHINFELFPRWYMDSILCTVWYTPSYHSIHHTRFKYNYSLFMVRITHHSLCLLSLSLPLSPSYIVHFTHEPWPSLGMEL